MVRLNQHLGLHEVLQSAYKQNHSTETALLKVQNDLFFIYLLHFIRGGGGGGTPKIFWQGCAAPVFDRIPLAKEILVENIPLAKEHFLIMSPFLHDFKEFQPKIPLFPF